MEKEILIKIEGTPRPKARGRIAGVKVGPDTIKNPRIVSIVDPLEKRWEQSVKSAASGVVRSLGGAAGVKDILGGSGEPLRIVCLFKIPTKDSKRWGKLHSLDGRNDTDNLLKLLKDSIWSCGIPGAFAGGDGRVAVEYVIKMWCAPREACCLVTMAKAGRAEEEITRILKC